MPSIPKKTFDGDIELIVTDGRSELRVTGLSEDVSAAVYLCVEKILEETQRRATAAARSKALVIKAVIPKRNIVLTLVPSTKDAEDAAPARPTTKKKETREK